MTNRGDTPPQIYVPTLNRTLIRKDLPEEVLFLDPGLPQTASLPGLFRPATYPFTPAIAAQALADLLSLGESLDLASAAGKGAARAASASSLSIDKTEANAIAQFAATGAHAPSVQQAENPLIAAQKVLLLAWDLEERLAEIEILRREVAGAAAPLAQTLRDPAEKAAVEELTHALASVGDLPETAEPDWRLTFAAMAAFLPPHAILVTAHESFRSAMLEAGMLLPLPEDASFRLQGWPEKLLSSLLWVQAPLWRVLGYARPPENAPWLLSAPEIVVCRPEGGR